MLEDCHDRRADDRFIYIVNDGIEPDEKIEVPPGMTAIQYAIGKMMGGQRQLMRRMVELEETVSEKNEEQDERIDCIEKMAVSAQNSISFMKRFTVIVTGAVAFILGLGVAIMKIIK